MVKIYDSDPEVYGRTTKIKPERTRDEINGILARFGIHDYAWRWNLKEGKIMLGFKVPVGKFEGSEMSMAPVKIYPHPIWHKNRRKADTINWKVSLRNMYWYILTHLSQAYVNQSGMFHEFLSNVINHDGRLLGDVMQSKFIALPEKIINKKLIQR